LVVKATVLLLIGFAASLAARRSKASARYLAFAAAFAALAALPPAMLLVPSVPIPIASGPIGYRAMEAEVVPAADALQAASSVQAAAMEAPISQASRWPGVAWIARWVWAGGALLVLGPFAYGLWCASRLRRYGLPCPELTQRVGGRAVEVLLHEDLSAPLTCGLLRPVILLPRDALQWREADLRRALTHEAEHVRRGDWAMQSIARGLCGLYWFHPLVWMAWHRLCLEAERACDDAALEHDEGPDYAEQLIALARRMSASPVSAALGMAKRTDLSRRVTAVLDANQARGRAGAAAAAAAIACMAIAVSAIAPMRAVAQTAGNREGLRALVRRERATASDRALFEVSERGDLSGMEELLRKGANVNAVLEGDGSPLIGAARRGHIDAVRLLLDRGADPNLAVEGDGNPLIAAAGAGRLEAVRLLLDRGADADRGVIGDGNALIQAARSDHMDVVTLLLDRGAKVNQMVPQDENAVTQASEQGLLSMVKLLVARGADVNSRFWVEGNAGAGEWRSPLIMARKRKHDAVVAYLLSVGARD
jgi:beta-lactamase regulating signal transducer with metallopeptidase domain